MKALTKNQSKQIDALASRKLGISTLVMMENAGIRIADFVLRILAKKKNKKVAVFCGRGNNCGDALVVSRQLASCGIVVDTYMLSASGRLSPEAKQNYAILSRISKAIIRIKSKREIKRIKLGSYALLVDGIFGIGLDREVKGIFKDAIEKINASGKIVVSIDIPSGLDADRGLPQGAAIKADYTLSLIAAKKGAFLNRGPEFCGKLAVEHIGFPVR